MSKSLATRRGLGRLDGAPQYLKGDNTSLVDLPVVTSSSSCTPGLLQVHLNTASSPPGPRPPPQLPLEDCVPGLGRAFRVRSS